MEPLEILLIIAGSLLSLALLILLLYLFVLVRPRKKKSIDPKLLCDYAHRGLHTDTVPENSMAAFARAVEAGVGIELDVQLSRDGEVMVFHDYTLTRMTGVEKKLCDLDATELCTLSLGGTEEKIPTLSEVLRLVDGRVPILVELKGESTDASLCAPLARILSAYRGAYCLESFNPILIGRMKKHLPQALRGLLYTNVCREKNSKSILNRLLSVMALNVLARPEFISYHQGYRTSLPVRITTKLFHAEKFVWTVRTEAELQAARKNGEHPIFEHVDPQK